MRRQLPDGRIEDIDILRAVAILMVLAEHLMLNLITWPTRFNATWQYWRGSAGVDLFFAISGFVIARTLLPSLEEATDATGRVRLVTAFLLRRWWRLQPMALLWLAIPLVLTVAFDRSGAFHTLDANLHAAFAALVIEENLYVGVVYAHSDAGILFPYWSLSLEEQFYLLLPAAALLLGRRLPWLLVALIAWQFFMPKTVTTILLRPGPLAAGVMLAMASRQASYFIPEPTFLGRSGLFRGAFFGGLLFVLGALEADLPQLYWSYAWGLVSFVTAALVYAASFEAGYVVRAGAVRAAALWVGSRSYAIYLVHLPMYSATREIMFRLHRVPAQGSLGIDLQYVGLGLGLTALAAELSHRLVERPGRRIGRRLAAGIGARQATA